MSSAGPVIDQAVYDERSLRIPAGYSWDDWLREVQDIQWRHRATLFWLGDAFNFGESRFGEIYTQAIEEYSEESIMRAMPVCREFPIERRRPIGFSFHAAVMAKDRASGKRIFTAEEANALLDRAVTEKMTRETFRELIAERKKAFIAAQAPVVQRSERAAHNGDVADSSPAEPTQDTPEEGAWHEELVTGAGVPPRSADVVNLFPPAPSATISADDAAEMLRATLRDGWLPDELAEAISVVLQDRERLIAESRLAADPRRGITFKLKGAPPVGGRSAP